MRFRLKRPRRPSSQPFCSPGSATSVACDAVERKAFLTSGSGVYTPVPGSTTKGTPARQTSTESWSLCAWPPLPRWPIDPQRTAAHSDARACTKRPKSGKGRKAGRDDGAARAAADPRAPPRRARRPRGQLTAGPWHAASIARDEGRVVVGGGRGPEHEEAAAVVVADLHHLAVGPRDRAREARDAREHLRQALAQQVRRAAHREVRRQHARPAMAEHRGIRRGAERLDALPRPVREGHGPQRHLAREPVVARRGLEARAVGLELLADLLGELRRAEPQPRVRLARARQVGAREEQARDVGEVVVAAQLREPLEVVHDVAAVRDHGALELLLERRVECRAEAPEEVVGGEPVGHADAHVHRARPVAAEARRVRGDEVEHLVLELEQVPARGLAAPPRQLASA